MCPFPPHSPHPLYNELDGVSRLQTHLCPNRLSGLEALCNGPGTNLLPFSRAWEVCFISPLICTHRGTGLLLANTMQTAFLSCRHGAERHNGKACYRPGVMGERCIPAQGFSNHVLAQGQLSSTEGGGRKIY